uniref:Pex N-terminal domain-containing protein n=1 Tax=Plectus sambesii TaxID=2011161 RepID=A0A914XGE1_9BILA
MANQSAVRGAHLASERVTVGQQPSIFDVLSQESLMSTLKPAFRHLVKYLASAYPGRFQKVHQFYDEVFAGFELLLQNYCLKNCGASFAENFYNMKRVVPATGKSPTDGWARVRSLIFLVAVPYLREKLDNLYDRLTLQAEVMGNQPPKTARDKLCKAFLAAYPWIKSALDFWTFALQFLYLISKSEVHSPFLKFAGVRLETLTPEDLARMGKQIEPLGPDAGMTLRIWRLLTGLPTVMFSGFSKVLGFGLFFLQFLDFWYSNEQTQKLNLGALPSPPAPQLVS